MDIQADVHTLFESDFYRILNFKCHCKECGESKPEYSQGFQVSFVRTGFFDYNVFKHTLEAHNGRVIVSKPGFEHTITHHRDAPNDRCTILEFTDSFYQLLGEQYHISHRWFFKNQDIHSILLTADAKSELLHKIILKHIGARATVHLGIDQLIIELIDHLFGKMAQKPPLHTITAKQKSNYLPAIEKAKQFINDHLSDDVSLSEIAEQCYISPFHFSRLFKALTGYAPYQYLIETRLHYAAILLKNTGQSATEIAFESGFNSLEHFTGSFTKKFDLPPSQFSKMS